MSQHNLEQNNSCIVHDTALNNEEQNRELFTWAINSRDGSGFNTYDQHAADPQRVPVGGLRVFQGPPGSNRCPPASLYPVKNYFHDNQYNQLYSTWLLNLVRLTEVFTKDFTKEFFSTELKLSVSHWEQFWLDRKRREGTTKQPFIRKWGAYALHLWSVFIISDAPRVCLSFFYYCLCQGRMLRDGHSLFVCLFAE